MKVISIWQPFASLAVAGHKQVETRGWPAPASLIGNMLGIASTKTLKPEQSAFFLDPDFRQHYEGTGLVGFSELPFGYLLGVVRLAGCEQMTEAMLEETPLREKTFGIWEPGRWAWRLEEPVMFEVPIPIRGKQGIFDWNKDAA